MAKGEGSRYDELRKMLQDRRREILGEVQEGVKDARVKGVAARRSDFREVSSSDCQGDIYFALVQMKADVLRKIEEALVRLEEGAYGRCSECEEEIASKRLRALPFAVRCKNCEEAREFATQRQALPRWSPGGLFGIE